MTDLELAWLAGLLEGERRSAKIREILGKEN